MPDVKIKKSVLQSIIRKSLSESGPKGARDVSSRLTVGPDRSSLPPMLPLSPSDRMSTQLEVERPPVEDPEYVPANSRELGLALHALAEMVPAEQVEKAYLAFQKIIERLEDEGSDDVETQLESVTRKNLILRALMEAEGDDDDDDFELSPEEEEEFARLEREEATGPDAMYFKYERVLNAYRLSKMNFMDMYRLVRTNELTQGDLEDFLDLLGSLQNDPTIVASMGSRLRSPSLSPDALLRLISRFKDEQGERVEREAAAARDAARPKFEYQSAAPQYGYAAASGLRQSFIRDIMGVRALNAFVAPRRIQSYVYNSIREAFLDAFEKPENEEFLKELFDEEGLTEYKTHMNDTGFLRGSALFQNFAGAVTYEALASIADLNFKSHRGQPGRKIGLAFMSEFGEENKRLQTHEEDQLEQMALRGEYADFVNDILDQSEENGHRGLLTAAAAMTADDADKDEYGKYASPAFSTLKKAASVSKPPELHVADYMGKDDPMVGKIKAADRAARKAARK